MGKYVDDNGYVWLSDEEQIGYLRKELARNPSIPSKAVRPKEPGFSGSNVRITAESRQACGEAIFRKDYNKDWRRSSVRSDSYGENAVLPHVEEDDAPDER